MNETKLEKAIRERNEFLKKYPHMQKLQAKLEQKLMEVGTDLKDPKVIEKRLLIMKQLLIDNIEHQLQPALNDLKTILEETK